MNKESEVEVKRRIAELKKSDNKTLAQFGKYLDYQLDTAIGKRDHFKDNLEANFIEAMLHSSIGLQAAGWFWALIYITCLMTQEVKYEEKLKALDATIQTHKNKQGELSNNILFALVDIQCQLKFVKGEV